MARPRPVPFPTSFVVKNGSKIRPTPTGGTPPPLSRSPVTPRSPPLPGPPPHGGAAIRLPGGRARVSARQRHEALDQIRTPACRADDVPEFLRLLGVPLAQRELEELGVGQNAREDVVEVMGDPAGQLPHGLHLLRLAQLALQESLLRHVLAESDEALEAAALADDGEDRALRRTRPGRDA